MAVTKKFSAQVIREAYEVGLRQFGENYVQEFAEKRPELADLAEAEFHLIGHLQSNKVKPASELFRVIHTVDSSKLLRRLDAASQASAPIEVLLEIKLADEESKTGMDAGQIPEVLAAAESCQRLRVRGLMTIPPWSEDAERSRPYFKTLAELAQRHGLGALSMGMSGDFEVAIEEGATIIRVGTALFGERPKVPAKPSPGA